MAILTVTALRRRCDGGDKWISDGAIRGCGALWARIGSARAAFYFRYTDSVGKKKAVALGPHDEAGARGLTLAQAREKASALSRLYRDGVRDLHEHLERQRAATERALRAQDEAATRFAEESQRSTLRQLLEAYVSHLEQAGKQSARDVRSIFTQHVIEAVPDLAERKAAELTITNVVELISRLIEAGKGRTAAKLRSYLRAAYSLAVRSAVDPAIPLLMRTFGVQVNPVAGVDGRSLARFNRTRDRVLSVSELGALLRKLDALPAGGRRDALQLCVLLGGQRPTQLLRAKHADVDLSEHILTLYDPKGTRQRPRVHRLPFGLDAAEILERRIRQAADGGKLFSSTVGTISALVHELSDQMVRTGEASEPFRLADLRRTAETMLAALKVSSDVRAQLLSHGLSGVQHRHYDRHDYMLEKRQALERWVRHLATLKSGKKAGVVPLLLRTLQTAT